MYTTYIDTDDMGEGIKILNWQKSIAMRGKTMAYLDSNQPFGPPSG
jgi:hypothetical protein